MENLDWGEKLDKFKLPIALSLVGLVLIIGGIFASGLNKSQPKTYPKESLIESQKKISVDVSGAVNKPAVYQLKEGARIEDAVAAAGGFEQDANKEYISKSLNMAQKLSDGSKVYIPVEGEAGGAAGTSVDTKVDINKATQAELEELDDIGISRASDIISGRPYMSVEELSSKKVIPQSVFEKIKDQLVAY